MPMDLKLYSDRSRYRAGSIVLGSVSYLAIWSVLLGTPAWLAFSFGVAAAIVLTIITSHRLRDAGLSSAWLLLMILQFGIGPAWHLSENVTFNAGGAIVGMLPVILGWIAPESSDRKSAQASDL